MRFQGRISEWNDDRGFGFVLENGTNKRIFLHIKSFSKRNRRPALGDVITYKIKTDSRGRINAEQSIFQDQLHESSNTTRGNRIQLPLIHPSISVVYIGFLITMVMLDKLPNSIPTIAIGLSLITFMVYYFDKSAAVNGMQRTPENFLHVLGLLGGWPGAALAQKNFRHKSSKKKFQIVFWLTVIVNICFTIYLLQIPGSSELHQKLTF